jgi:hypothetical protein
MWGRYVQCKDAESSTFSLWVVLAKSHTGPRISNSRQKWHLASRVLLTTNENDRFSSADSPPQERLNEARKPAKRSREQLRNATSSRSRDFLRKPQKIVEKLREMQSCSNMYATSRRAEIVRGSTTLLGSTRYLGPCWNYGSAVLLC